MGDPGYLFEKACYVAEGLTRVVEDIRLQPVGSPAEREVSAYLNVALRHGLLSCCTIAGATFEGRWVAALSRRGRSAWEDEVKPALDAAIFGPEERGSVKEGGVPRAIAPDSPAREVQIAELLPSALSTAAALLDLTEVAHRHGCHQLEDGQFRSHLGYAFNGATKVLASLLDVEWDIEWPGLLADQGRAGYAGLLATLRSSEEAWRFAPDDLGTLEEAWLVALDPERTPEAEQAAERERRANVTRANRMPHDLGIPPRHRDACLDGLLDVPGHSACAEFARSPDGALLIHGEFASGMFEVQWAIARFWFVDELKSVGALSWQRLVEDNVLAQNRGIWECPYLILESLCPVWLDDRTCADPGYAERMLEYRLARGLPTVMTIERYGLETLNLRSRTVHLLESSANVVLPPLTDKEREGSTMFK